LLSVNDIIKQAMFIAVDIGATNTRVAGFSSETPDSLLTVEKIAASQEYGEFYTNLVTLIKQVSKGEPIEKISIGSTGLVSPDKTMLIRCAFLPALANKPFVTSLSSDFHTEVILNNDAMCSAMGESYFGVGRNGTRILYITISTGMGGAFVKKDHDTAYIMPAEIGHTIVDLHGKICECGQKGCIGAYAHGRGLEERFLMKPENIDDIRVWEEVAEYLTIGVINGARIFMPDTIVFSGAIVEAREYVLQKIKQLYEKRSVIRPMPELVKSQFGDNSVLYGALAFLSSNHIVYI